MKYFQLGVSAALAAEMLESFWASAQPMTSSSFGSQASSICRNVFLRGASNATQALCFGASTFATESGLAAVTSVAAPDK